MTVPAKTPAPGDIMESLLIGGDLGKLKPADRVVYYNKVCDSLGLNPLTQPFAYITLNGKLQLYALRAATDQLRKINGVSLAILSRDVADGVLTIHVKATLPDGRSDEDLGAVAFPETLKGEARANAELKAITKAKRRATLSICGLGWLDETEIQDIPASAKRPAPPAPNAMLDAPKHDAKTGEVIEDTQSAAEQATPRPAADAAPSSQPPIEPLEDDGAVLSIEDQARAAARKGKIEMRLFFNNLEKSEQVRVNQIRPELNRLVDAAEALGSKHDAGRAKNRDRFV